MREYRRGTQTFEFRQLDNIQLICDFKSCCSSWLGSLDLSQQVIYVG